MVAVNKSFQSGHARAYIEHRPMDATNRLFVMIEDHTVVGFHDGGLYFQSPPPQGTFLPDDIAALMWTDYMEDTLVDIWKAIGKALEVYDDEPSQAYKQGYAEGEAQVLREWNESLRGG